MVIGWLLVDVLGGYYLCGVFFFGLCELYCWLYEMEVVDLDVIDMCCVFNVN